MTRFFVAKFALLTLVCALAANGEQAQLTYKIIDHPSVPGRTVLQSRATGINDSGQIVGIYFDDLFTAHGYLLIGTQFTILNFPGAQHTQPYGINSHGDVVGVYANDGDDCDKSFLLKNGIYSTLPDGPSPLVCVSAYGGINDNGQIVGQLADPTSGTTSGFIYNSTANTYTVVNYPGAQCSEVQGINNSGVVVGYYQNTCGLSTSRAFKFDGTSYTPITLPVSGSIAEWASGINSGGQIVGGYQEPIGIEPERGYIIDGGQFRTIDVPNALSTTVMEINSIGQVVGFFFTGSTLEAFVASPPDAYNLCFFYDSTKAVKSGSTIPIKLQLCDSNNQNRSSPSIALHAVNVTKTSSVATTTVQDAGNANPDSDFRYDSSIGGSGGYIFNLKTTGLSIGAYTLDFIVGNGATIFHAPFQVR